MKENMKLYVVSLLLITTSLSAEDISLCKQGWGEYQRGNYHKSIELFNKCIDQGQLSQATLARTYRNMGIVANGSHQSKEALVFYNQAIALNPKDIWYDYVNKGNALSNLGQFDEAILSYQKAFHVKPDFNEAYYNLGLVYDRMGKAGKAMGSYKKAYEHGLNTPQLMERITYHGIEISPIDKFDSLSTEAKMTQHFPVNEINQVNRMNELSCGANIGRSFSQHPDHQLIKTEKSYEFIDYGIKFKLPKLPIQR